MNKYGKISNRNSYFVKHLPCPVCGSRDNLGTYSDGGAYCFGCGYVQKPSVSPYVKEKENELQFSETYTHPTSLGTPEDACRQYGTPGVEWVCSFGITVEELLARGVYWSPSKQQLIFTWTDNSGEIILAQGRNFNPVFKQKYYTYGKPEETLPIYYRDTKKCLSDTSTNRRVVIVEDCLSAIKIARQSDSMPVLGSDISRDKLSRLARFYGSVRVWLDGNMFHKAQRMAQRLEMLGLEAKAIYTELDPKCYSDEEICNYLLT